MVNILGSGAPICYYPEVETHKSIDQVTCLNEYKMLLILYVFFFFVDVYVSRSMGLHTLGIGYGIGGVIRCCYRFSGGHLVLG